MKETLILEDPKSGVGLGRLVIESDSKDELGILSNRSFTGEFLAGKLHGLGLYKDKYVQIRGLWNRGALVQGCMIKYTVPNKREDVVSYRMSGRFLWYYGEFSEDLVATGLGAEFEYKASASSSSAQTSILERAGEYENGLLHGFGWCLGISDDADDSKTKDDYYGRFHKGTKVKDLLSSELIDAAKRVTSLAIAKAEECKQYDKVQFSDVRIDYAGFLTGQKQLGIESFLQTCEYRLLEGSLDLARLCILFMLLPSTDLESKPKSGFSLIDAKMRLAELFHDLINYRIPTSPSPTAETKKDDLGFGLFRNCLTWAVFAKILSKTDPLFTEKQSVDKLSQVMEDYLILFDETYMYSIDDQGDGSGSELVVSIFSTDSSVTSSIRLPTASETVRRNQTQLLQYLRDHFGALSPAIFRCDLSTMDKLLRAKWNELTKLSIS